MDILELQTLLDRQAEWRKQELTQAYELASSAEEKYLQYLCRAWVLMLYAHCDNFLKESSKNYINFLKSNNNPNYKPELIWLIMKSKMLQESQKQYRSYEDFSREVPYKFLDEQLLKDIFKEGSFGYRNLRFICDWVLQIKFDHSKLSGFCNSIKNKRDSIAHGEECYVDKEKDCLLWHHKTIEFINSLKDSLITSAASLSD